MVLKNKVEEKKMICIFKKIYFISPHGWSEVAQVLSTRDRVLKSM